MISPALDPTVLFELHRGNYTTELLAAAVSHLDLFTHIARADLSLDGICREFGLSQRSATVLITALRAMGLLASDVDGYYRLTPLARQHLVVGAAFDITGYIGLMAQTPGVLEMVQRLRTSKPAGAEPEQEGVAFIYREGIDSAMDQEQSARRLTLALAGRAKIVAPALAANVDLSQAELLLDAAGGTGIYAIACLLKFPKLKAVVLDRPEVLKVAEEMAENYRVTDRLQLMPGDMFADAYPQADIVLLSNVLHDWDIPECEKLLQRAADALPAGGRVLIHDVFMNDALDGPLPLALYSAALFSQTEGRVYSGKEYRQMLESAGFQPSGTIVPTAVHCGVLTGVKP